MAKLSSPRTELAVLKAACNESEHIANLVISKTDHSYFYSVEAKDAFTLIRRLKAETGAAVSWRMLLEDPQLPKESAEFLRNAQDVIKNKEQALKAIASLNEYRKRRILGTVANKIGDALEGPTVDSKVLLEEVNTALNGAKSTKEGTIHTRFGLRDNSSNLIHDILYTTRKDHIIPTGFKTFDDINGGFFLGSLVALGGNTGGGKCLVGSTLVRVINDNNEVNSDETVD